MAKIIQHVGIKLLGLLLTRSGLTHPEVSSVWSSLVPSAFVGVFSISLGNLLRGIRFACCMDESYEYYTRTEHRHFSSAFIYTLYGTHIAREQ
jgi:hypothetical protein